MTDTGWTYILNRFLDCKTKTEGKEFLANVGRDYQDLAGRLFARLSYPRTNNQNATYYGRIAEIAKQTHETELEVRRYVKYTFGLPILFRTMPEHAELCRNHLGNMDHEQKLKMMDLFQVSSLMKTHEMKEYMNQIAMHYRSQGLTITEPKKQ